MAGGRDNNLDDRLSGGIGGRVPEPLKDKLIAALVAVVVGGGSVTIFGRPDPWTATQDRQRMDEAKREWFAELDRRLQPFDQHLRLAEQWKERIRQCEFDAKDCTRRLGKIERGER